MNSHVVRLYGLNGGGVCFTAAWEQRAGLTWTRAAHRTWLPDTGLAHPDRAWRLDQNMGSGSFSKGKQVPSVQMLQSREEEAGEMGPGVPRGTRAD